MNRFVFMLGKVLIIVTCSGMLALFLAGTAQAELQVTRSVDGRDQRIQVEIDQAEPIQTRRDGRFLELRSETGLSALALSLAPVLGGLADVDFNPAEPQVVLLAANAGNIFTDARADRSTLEFKISKFSEKAAIRIGRHPDFIRLVVETDRVAAVRHQLSNEGISIEADVPVFDQNISELEQLVPGLAIDRLEPDRVDLRTQLPVKTFTIPPRKFVVDFALVDSGHAEAPTSAETANANEIHPKEAAKADTADEHAPKSNSQQPHAGPSAPPVEQAKQPENVHAEHPQLGISAEISQSPPLSAKLRLSAGRNSAAPFLELNWGHPVPIAVYWRGSSLWVVSHAKSQGIESDVQSIRQYLGAYISRFEQVPHPEATVLMVEAVEKAFIIVESQEEGWRLYFHEHGRSGGALPIELVDGAMRLGPASASAEITDPIIGDRIAVALSTRPHMEQTPLFRAPDLTSLPSAIGGAFAIHSDGMSSKLTAEGLVLERPGGLRIRGFDVAVKAAEPESWAQAHGKDEKNSHGLERPGPGLDGEAAPPVLPSFETGLDLASFRELSREPLLKAKREVSARFPQDTALSRALRALDLARLYLAYGLSAEAVTQLDTITAYQSDFSEAETDELAKAVLILKAAARNWHKPGQPEALQPEVFDEDPEIGLWRAIAAIRSDNWQYDAGALPALRETLASYPILLQARFGNELAGRLLQLGYVDAAFAIVDGLELLPLAPDERSALLRTKGRGFVRDGDTSKGLALIREAENLAGFDERHEITAERLLLSIDAGQISPGAALKELQALRPFWRGLANEAQLMELTGDLYLEDNQIAPALAVWRLAADRDQQAAVHLIERMRRHFSEFVHGDNWQRSPFEALELLRSYRELVPTGSEGRKLVLDLAGDFSRAGYPELAKALIGQLIGQTEAERANLRALDLQAALLQSDKDKAREIIARFDGTEVAKPTLVDPQLLETWLDQARFLASAPADSDPTISASGNIPSPLKREQLWEGQWLAELGDVAKAGDTRFAEIAGAVAQNLPDELHSGDGPMDLVSQEIGRLAADRQRIEELTRWP